MTEMQFDFTGSMGAEVAKESNKGGDFQREIEYLSLDGSVQAQQQGTNQIIVRFVTRPRRTDDAPITKFNLPWITADQHYTQTKPKPEYVDKDRKWPVKMAAGCRADKIFAQHYPGGCMFCQRGEKASSRIWALAVEREQVRDQQGNVLGWQDKTREVFDTDEKGDLIVESESGGKKTYKKKIVPAWIVVNMGWKNFYGPLEQSASFYGQQNGNDGLLDADWAITRAGEGNNDTVYTFHRIADQTLPEGNQFGLPGGTRYDLSIPGLAEKIYGDAMPDLRKIIAGRVSDDYLGRFFVPGWVPEGWTPGQNQGGGQGTTAAASGVMSTFVGSAPTATPPTPQPQQQQTAEPSPDALAALQQRVLSGGQ